MNFKGASILSVDQFERADLQQIFDVATEMEVYANHQKLTRVLEGAVLGNLFFEPSTRSRVSFGAAFNRLGGEVRDTTGFTFSSMAKGESIHDTSRVISGYVDCLVVRHPEEGAVQQFADATNIPVINGGDGPGEHPTQALLDLYTVAKEHGKNLDEIDGLSIAMIGDLKHGRTVHSLTKLLALFDNISFTFVAPDELRMPDGILERARSRDHNITETEDMIEGIKDVDVIYMTRIQEERFSAPEEFAKYRGKYSLNRATYEQHCRENTAIMHPLPRDSRPGANELDNDLNGHPKLAIFRQTDNGIPIRMALFAMVMDVADKVHDTARDAIWYRPESIDTN
ncbi:MAG: aspartate carbamoyltransferase [bacterium]|nr:aspartate carbamoyltransferase [bacterium]